MTTENPVKPTDVDKALLGTATYRSLGEQKLSPRRNGSRKADAPSASSSPPC